MCGFPSPTHFFNSKSTLLRLLLKLSQPWKQASPVLSETELRAPLESQSEEYSGQKEAFKEINRFLDERRREFQLTSLTFVCADVWVDAFASAAAAAAATAAVVFVLAVVVAVCANWCCRCYSVLPLFIV